MPSEKDLELSHVSFTVLGLISEYPCHGKDINGRIEERGMRAWTAIGESSVYGVLRNLKENGLVDSWMEEENNRLVKIYKITDKGINLLKKRIYKTLNEYNGRNDPDFYMAFSMLPYLSEKELIEVFKNSLKTIKKHKLELEKMLGENSKMPLNVRGLFIHPINILQTDIEFLEMVLDEIKKGGGQINTKTHNK